MHSRLLLTTILAGAVRTSVAATCYDNKPFSDESSGLKGSDVATILKQRVGEICSSAGSSIPNNDNTWNYGQVNFRIKDDSGKADSYCGDGLNNIIDQCINGAVWGGEWVFGTTRYTIENAVYPQNPFDGLGDGIHGQVDNVGALVDDYVQTGDDSKRAGVEAAIAAALAFATATGATSLVGPLAGALEATAAGAEALASAWKLVKSANSSSSGGNDGGDNTGDNTGGNNGGNNGDDNGDGNGDNNNDNNDNNDGGDNTGGDGGDGGDAPGQIPQQPGNCNLITKRDFEVEVLKVRESSNLHRIKKREVEATSTYPLQSAMAMLGPDSAEILQSSNLKLVTTHFPVEMRYRFVTGLEGRVTKSVNVRANGDIPAVRMQPGDLFRIRWDFDDGEKGVHVNAEFFGTSGTTKVAWTPKNQPLSSNSNELYQQVLNKQSGDLDYSTKPNTDSTRFSPQDRTGENGEEVQRKALQRMAKQLAEHWVANGC